MTRLPLVCLLIAAPLAFAAAATRPVVVELFTSESCSSCPPADALLVDLARHDPSVLPLGFHVDYWDYLKWHDRYSSHAATTRQRAYAAALGTEVYTPQLVVDGRGQAVGSDRTAVLAAIKTARAAVTDGPPVTLAASGDHVTVHVGPGFGMGSVLLVGFDPAHTTAIGGGENTGRTLDEANVVRGFQQVGQWRGTAIDITASRPAGERLAVILQADDGHILAAQLSP